MIRPPLGVMPRWLHEEINYDDLSSESRLTALKAAIERYKQAGKPVDSKWLIEKSEIENAIKDRQQA